MTLTDNITGLQCSGHMNDRIEFKLVNLIYVYFFDIIDIIHPLGKTSGDLNTELKLAPSMYMALSFMIPKLQLGYIIIRPINLNLWPCCGLLFCDSSCQQS